VCETLSPKRKGDKSQGCFVQSCEGEELGPAGGESSIKHPISQRAAYREEGDIKQQGVERKRKKELPLHYGEGCQGGKLGGNSPFEDPSIQVTTKKCERKGLRGAK